MWQKDFILCECLWLKWNESQKRGKMHSAHNTVELQVQLPPVDIMNRWYCCPERAMVSQSDWVSMGRLSFQLCLKCLLHAQVLEAWPPVLGHLYWEEGLWRWLASEGLTSGVCCPINRSTALWAIRERERCYGRGLIGDSRPLESCAWKQYFPLTSPPLLFLCILAIVSEQLFSPACSPANNLPEWMAQSHWSWVTVDWQLWNCEPKQTLEVDFSRYFATAMEVCWELYWWYLLMICFSIWLYLLVVCWLLQGNGSI